MTMVIAHRGASVRAPENTLEAFRTAVALGADAVELDVRRTADDQLVVHHDAVVAGGEPIVGLARRDLPPHVPDLTAALDACAGAWVNVEVKNDPGEPDFDATDAIGARVAEVLAARGEPQRWLVSAFRLETADAARRAVPAIRTAWLVAGVPDGRTPAATVAALVERGHSALHPWVVGLDRDLVRRCHAAGIAVNTWTCDDPRRMRELIAWGVDGICTNVPDVAVDVRAGA